MTWTNVYRTRGNPMGALKAKCGYGHSHRSKLESSVCQIIQLRERAGEIKLLQVEDHVLLSGWYRYVPDFKCEDMKTGVVFWIEAKGYGDARWPSTKKGWKHAGPGRLEIWGGSHTNPKLVEIIEPRIGRVFDRCLNCGWLGV